MPPQRTACAGGDQALKPGVGWERRLGGARGPDRASGGALEGLQDAVYRQAILEDDKIDEVRRRTAPEQMARDLSRDARRRGL